MIKKNSNSLKKIAIVSAILILMLNIAIYNAFAADIPVPGSDAERGQQIMNQMMGSNYNSMNEFMDQIMGENGSQSMYNMMGKINASGLNANDTKPLGDFMNACQSRTASTYNTGGMMGNWNWNNMMGYGFGGGILGGLIMIFFWIIIILAGLALLRWLANNLTGNANTAGKAMEILKEKYAKGEITKKEFELKKKDIA